MAEEERIYDSAPPERDDDFWLEQGKKMVGESLTAVREAAKAVMTGLGLLKGIYLGILGFAEFIPKTLPVLLQGLFVVPLLLWLISLYSSLSVMMTEQLVVNLRSPDEIRNQSEQVLRDKQGALKSAFWWLTAGLLAAMLLMIFRLKL